MSTRFRRVSWQFVLLILVIGFCVRGRSNAPTQPSSSIPKPTASEGVFSPPVSGLASRPEPVREAVRPYVQSISQRSDKRLILRVVGVHDGDTLTGLDDAKTQHKIRLDAIDAPELGQPFGQASKKALSEKVFGKTVVVVPKKTDRWGRTIGHVMVDDRDVNLEMLEQGMAWHYKQFDQNRRLAQAEQSARDAKKGLWQDREPVPPWDWRRR